jgi:small ligand-binding sensory domain FIST
MEKFALGHARGNDWRAVGAACARQLRPLSADANLGFLYFSERFGEDARAIVEFLKAETGIADWVGTSGHGVLGGAQEYYGEPAIVAMVGAFPRDSYHLFRADHGDFDGFLRRHQSWLKQSDTHFGVVHADPRTPNLDSLLPRFVAATASFLVGGLTSSSGSYPQVAESVSDESPFSGVLFAEDVEVVTGLTQGCTPLGAAHTVTEARGNVAITLDDRPALDVLKADIGEILARDLKRIGGYIYVAFPVAGSDRGDYVVRNLIGIDPARSLVGIAARLEPGQRLMFCRRDAASATEDLQRMLTDLKRRARRPARGAVYYSCVARGPNMFGADSGETRAIRAAFGDIPMVGFFCNGEISHDRLYGYTGVLSLFL